MFLKVFYNGWKTYYGQPSLWAGVALSLLYMTVLGFDSITIGYIYASHVSPFFCSLAMSLGGLMGLLGTLAFTRARSRLGLERTGLFAFNLEVSKISKSLLKVLYYQVLKNVEFKK